MNCFQLPRSSEAAPPGEAPRLRPPPRLKSPTRARTRSQLPVSTAPARSSPTKSPEPGLSLRDGAPVRNIFHPQSNILFELTHIFFQARGTAVRHSVAEPPAPVSRIPVLRHSESPPKVARVSPASDGEAAPLPAHSGRGEAAHVTPEHLAAAVSGAGLFRTGPSGSEAGTLDSMEDSQPKTFIVSCSPGAGHEEAREVRETAADREPVEPVDNNADNHSTDNGGHSGPAAASSQTIYQSTVSHTHTPYITRCPAPALDLVRRASGPSNLEYITLNIAEEPSTASSTDKPSTASSTDKQSTASSSTEKLSRLEPIYECSPGGRPRSGNEAMRSVECSSNSTSRL